jgi:FMN phosphatase YigB (HAD superfamily)
VKNRAWIFDIDGTLANTDHRIHHIKPANGQKKNWGKFFAEAEKDEPFRHVRYLHGAITCFGLLEKDYIFVITARPENLRKETDKWLQEHSVSYNKLFMRPVNERKPDYEVKRDIYREHIKPKYDVVAAFEDRLQVAKMWREEGVPVLLCGDEWLKNDWSE